MAAECNPGFIPSSTLNSWIFIRTAQPSGTINKAQRSWMPVWRRRRAGGGWRINPRKTGGKQPVPIATSPASSFWSRLWEQRGKAGSFFFFFLPILFFLSFFFFSPVAFIGLCWKDMRRSLLRRAGIRSSQPKVSIRRTGFKRRIGIIIWKYHQQSWM